MLQVGYYIKVDGNIFTVEGNNELGENILDRLMIISYN